MDRGLLMKLQLTKPDLYLLEVTGKTTKGNDVSLFGFTFEEWIKARLTADYLLQAGGMEEIIDLTDESDRED
jgi:hypothetical protein